MIDDRQNIAGTRMTCTDPDCGCELEIISPCPHGGGYRCACGHEMQPTS
jgi:hypothetical protein